MKIPLNWLKEYIEGNLEIKEVADALTMSGLEVAAIEEIDGDTVLDLEITPNRPDCLSIIGVAREIKAIFGLELRKPQFRILKELKDEKFNVFIANPELCYRYAGRIVKGVKVTSSPEWLSSRIQKAGIRSINNVVDVTNYVLLEYGHPLHAFDLDFLEGYCIRIGTPRTILGKDSVNIVTLDGVKRTAGPEDLLIWDGKRPVAIAGIMGGANTEVTEKTVNIFIESAYFKPESVRKTSKRMGLITESSYRFERGADIENLIVALDRAASLIQEIAGGEVYEVIDIYPTRIPRREILFTPEKICKFIGINLKEEEILRILSLLEIEVKRDKEAYIALVPSHRQDLVLQEDIAEEVARIYGYDKVPAELPVAFKPVSEDREVSEKRKFLNQARQCMITLGYSEAVNMSFMSPEDLNLFEIPEKDVRKKFISLMNPLRHEESIMRTMILPGLLRNVEKNSARGIETLKLFEIGRVFIAKNGSPLPEEPVHLGVISKREDFKSPFGEDPYDFYALKGVIEGFIKHLKIQTIQYTRSVEPFLHTGQSADIYVNNEKIGYLGVISPKLLTALNFKTKPYICMAEIDLDKLFNLFINLKLSYYKPFSVYPPVKRDVAVLVSSDFEARKIFDLIKAYKNEVIEDVYIFDVYKGKGIPEGKLSIAFRIVYRAFDRTLTSEEVDSIHSKLVKKIISETGAELRL